MISIRLITFAANLIQFNELEDSFSVWHWFNFRHVFQEQIKSPNMSYSLNGFETIKYFKKTKSNIFYFIKDRRDWILHYFVLKW